MPLTIEELLKQTGVSPQQNLNPEGSNPADPAAAPDPDADTGSKPAGELTLEDLMQMTSKSSDGFVAQGERPEKRGLMNSQQISDTAKGLAIGSSLLGQSIVDPVASVFQQHIYKGEEEARLKALQDPEQFGDALEKYNSSLNTRKNQWVVDKLAPIQNSLEDFEDDMRERQSPQYKFDNERLQRAVAEADKGLEKWKTGFFGVLSDRALWGPKLAELGAPLAGQAVVGRVAGLPAALVMGGLQAGQDARDELLQEVILMDEAFFMGTERWVELGKAGFTDDEARERLHHELANELMMEVTVASALVNALPVFNRAEKILSGAMGAAKKGILKKAGGVAATTVGEIASETVEEEAQSALIGRKVQENFDPLRDPLRDLGRSGEAAALGGKTGFALQSGRYAADAFFNRDSNSGGSADITPIEVEGDPVDDYLEDIALTDEEKAAKRVKAATDYNKDKVNPKTAEDIQQAQRIGDDGQLSLNLNNDPEVLSEQTELGLDEPIQPADDPARVERDPPPPLGVNDPPPAEVDGQIELDLSGEPTQGSLNLNDPVQPEPQAPRVERDPPPPLGVNDPPPAEVDGQLEIDLRSEPTQGSLNLDDPNAPPVEQTSTDLPPLLDNVDDLFPPREQFDNPTDPVPTEQDNQSELDLRGEPQQLGLDIDNTRQPAEQVSDEQDIDQQAREQAIAELRADDNYTFDSELESDDFINQLEQQAGITNSATAESQANPLEQTTEDSQNENGQIDGQGQRPTQQRQDNDGNRSTDNSQEGGSRNDTNSRQSEDNATAGGVNTSESTQRNEEANQSEESTNAENVSNASTPKKPSIRSRDRKRVDAYLQKLVDKTNGRVKVFDNYLESNLSDEVKALIEARENDPDQPAVTPALYNPETGEIYMFSDHIASQREAKGLMAHEVVHAGLRVMFGSESSIEAALLKMFEGNPDARAIMHRIIAKSDFDPEMYRQTYSDGSKGRLKTSLVLEEALAHMREVEAAQPAVKKLFREAVNVLKSFGVVVRARSGVSTEQSLIKLVKDAERAFYADAAKNASQREATHGIPKSKLLPMRYSLKPVEQQAEWFSTLYDAAVALKREKGHPNRMLADIKKAPGIKQEEIEWTGLEDFLALKNDSVTKDEIVEYLFNNGLEIVTVIKRSVVKDREEYSTQINWVNTTLQNRQNYLPRLTQMMNDYASGNWDKNIMDMDAKVKAHLEKNPDELVGMLRSELAGKDRELAALQYVMRAMGTKAGRDMAELQIDMFGKDSIDQAIEESGIEDAFGSSFELKEFAKAMAEKDIQGAMDAYDYHDYVDYFAIKFTKDYRVAAERVAKKEYEADPIIEHLDPVTGFTVRGSESRGWTVQLADEYVDHIDPEQLHHETLQEAKDFVQEERDIREADSEFGDPYNDYDEAYSFIGDTEHQQYLDREQGVFRTWYDEVLLRLPYVGGSFTNDTHFGIDNVVAFVRASDRTIVVRNETDTGWNADEVTPYHIEEMQSDWHQKGNKRGYAPKDGRERYLNFQKLRNSLYLRAGIVAKNYATILDQEAGPENWDALAKANDRNLVSKEQIYRTLEESSLVVGLATIIPSLKHVMTAQTFARYVKSVKNLKTKLDNYDTKLSDAIERMSGVPDVPYKEMRWIDLAARKVMMEAISKGYEHIAWSDKERVLKRWNNNPKLENLFDTIYDVKLPAVFKKLAGNKPRRTLDNNWIVEIDRNKASEYREKGMPKMALRRISGPGLTNRPVANGEPFQRKGWWKTYDAFMDTMVDEYHFVSRLMDRVRENSGRVDDETDFNRALKRIPGQTMPLMNRIKGDFVEPFARRLKETDVTAEEQGLFAYMLHAPERNKRLRERFNLPAESSPSGMSDAEVRLLTQYFKNSGKFDAMMETDKKFVKPMRRYMLETMQEHGLLTEYQVAEYDASYQHWITLKGFSATIDESGIEVEAPFTRPALMSKGKSVTRPEFRRMLGRQTKAFDPISTLISDMMQAAVRSQYNEAGNHLLRFVAANPDPNLWGLYTDANPKMHQGQRVQSKDPVTGEITETIPMVKMSPLQMSQQMFGTKYKGKQYYIDILDPALKHTIINAEPTQIHTFLKPLRAWNRWRSYMLTSVSPAFAVTNFMIDMPTAYLKILAEQTRDDGQLKDLDKGIAHKTVAMTVPVMRTMFRMLRGLEAREGNKWDAYAREMQDNGGLVGFYTTKSPEQVQQDVVDLIRNGQTAWGNTKIAIEKIADAIDIINRTLENSVRLSAYIAAREAGATPKGAADMARPLTTDFNSKGRYGNQIGSFFLFYNAAIQGSRNTKRVMWGVNEEQTGLNRLNRAQQVVAGLLAFHVGWSFLLRAMMGKDDDGEDLYDKIDSRFKERYMVIPKFWQEDGWENGWNNKNLLTIRMPYGYNVFSAMGTSIEAIISKGPKEVPAQAGFMVKAIAGAFSPVSIAQSKQMPVTGTVLRTAAPEVLKPWLDIYGNENFFGAPIYDDPPYADGSSNASRGRLNTPDIYKRLALSINDFSGGSGVYPGEFDIHPEIFQHWWKYVSGGAGTFGERSIGETLDWLEGEPYEIENMPILATFNSKITDYSDISTFYEKSIAVNSALGHYKTALASGDKELKDETLRRFPKLIQLARKAKVSRKLMKLLRDQREAATLNRNLDSAERYKIVKDIEEEMGALADEFNKDYFELQGDADRREFK